MAGQARSRYFARQAAAAAARTRVCDWPGCEESGEYRAPRSRDNLRDFQFLCLEHIREFNRSWNFFEGWSREEIERYQQDDLIWHRRTWKPGERLRWQRAWQAFMADEMHEDPFRVLEDEEEEASGGHGRTGRGLEDESGTLGSERRALSILRLEPGASRTDIKRRFKEEVKRHHPDANGGDKAAEERLRLAIWAYRELAAKPGA